MKRFLVLTISLFLLLGQWGSLEHMHHDHQSGEACDYCLQLKSTDQLHTSTEQFNLLTSHYQWIDQYASQFVLAQSPNYFAIRAPPRFI